MPRYFGAVLRNVCLAWSSVNGESQQEPGRYSPGRDFVSSVPPRIRVAYLYQNLAVFVAPRSRMEVALRAWSVRHSEPSCAWCQAGSALRCVVRRADEAHLAIAA